MPTTTTTDPFLEFKAKQREGWAYFAPIEIHTTEPAARLVSFAKVESGERVLDVGTGTGVVAVTAARRGARVTGLDFTPELLARAAEHSATAGVQVEWREGDAESLPFEDGSFDVVLSQWGHMFAPRPEVAIAEMLRVLRSGGRIAFTTWPPEHFMGRMFAMVSKYVPPPQGAMPPGQWGDPNVVRERLGAAVRDLRFDREVLVFPTLSAPHYRSGMELTAGPVVKLVQMLTPEPARLAEARKEFETLVSQYLDENTIRKDYLLTRAIKV